MRSGKRHLLEETELPNQEKIRIPGEKESNKSLGKLEKDSIKQVERKEKLKMSISEGRGNYWKPK